MAQNQQNTILHIDMDAFYASVEQRNQPEYREKPLIVGGIGNRGVVCSASYEARAFGVRSAMSSKIAKRLCPQAIFIHPNLALYEEESNKIHDIFYRYTPQIEPISLDEAYLEVGGSKKLFGSAETIGKKIQEDILKELDLSASVGVSCNKFLAKIASDMKKPKGFCIISYQNRHEVLDPLPVNTINGVGKKTAEILYSLGIRTIKDLRNIPLSVLQSCLGNQATSLLSFANGEDESVVTVPTHSLSIGREHTFGDDIYEEEFLQSYLQTLADEVASRLRRRQYKAYTITVKVKYADFTLVTRSITLETSTHQMMEIYQQSRQLLTKLKDIRKKGVRLLGVSTSHLTTQADIQLSLFEEKADERQNHLDQVMDRIRGRFGSDSISLGTKYYTKKTELDK